MTLMISKTQRSYFNAAKECSYQSDFPRVHIGAAVVLKHKVISRGWNSATRTHRLQAELNKKRFQVPSLGQLHAEVAALLPVINKYDLSGATLYVYRESLNGNVVMSRPCAGCMSLIRACGIKKIYYTTPEGFAEEHLLDEDV